jgi:hypothetical protein
MVAKKKETVDVETVDPKTGELITTTIAVPSAPVQESLGEVAIRTGNLEMLRIWQKRQFLRAFALAQAELPSIVKDREVDYTSKRTGEQTHYKYEDLGKMLDQLRPVLSKHGLSLRFPTESLPNGVLKMTAILAHDDGHEEMSSMTGQSDTSGSKNPNQAQGSTASYLQRYLTKMLLGFAAAYDDDGRASGGVEEEVLLESINAEQLQKLTEELVAAHASSDDFLTLVRRKYPKVKELGDIPAEAYQKCLVTIKGIADKKNAAGNGKDSPQ